MYIVFEVITTITLIAIMHIFMQGMFEKKKRHVWWWLTAYGIYGIGLTIFSLFPELSMLRMLYNTVCMTILCIVLFKAKTLTAIFASISMSAIWVLTDILMFVLLAIFSVDMDNMMTFDASRMVYTAVSQIVGLLIVAIILMITRRKRSAITLPFIIMLSPGYIVSIVIGCKFCLIVEENQDIYTIPFVFIALLLVYLNILIIFYAERAKESAQKQKEIEISEHHYAMQEQYYEQLRSEQNETRALFHDINKYLGAMRALASEVHSDKATQVMEEAQSLFDNIGNIVDVGNSVISVIISQYLEAAEMEKIYFSYDISVPEELCISASDAYILIGNTIDNAIEASSNVSEEKRFVHIKLKMINNILFYQIQNAFNPQISKREKNKYHGYGLKSVKRCIDKYDGDMSISKDNGIFTLSARMNFNRELATV